MSIGSSGTSVTVVNEAEDSGTESWFKYPVHGSNPDFPKVRGLLRSQMFQIIMTE